MQHHAIYPYSDTSVYREAFQDPDGIVLNIPGADAASIESGQTAQTNIPALSASVDATDALQETINRVAREQISGIVYIPSGTYTISRTILIPKGIRLIGFGDARPHFILAKSTPGFDVRNFMFWFIGNTGADGSPVFDANPGTFYSAISNIDMTIEDGNPGAICVRSHFAQHAFVSHCSFHIGNGFAGIYDVGNEMEHLYFEGGEFGIYTHSCSPGWPFVLTDSAFTGQRQAAVATRETGFTGFRLHISKTPAAFAPLPDETPGWEKLYLEDCLFEDISGAAVRFYLEDNCCNQYNMKNVICHNVPVFAKQLESGRLEAISYSDYRVLSYLHGKTAPDMEASSNGRVTMQTICDAEPLASPSILPKSDIPALPDMSLWKSIRDFGAVGDGVTDDTEALRKAIRSAKILYFPQGLYRVTDTITMEPDTQFIGMNPISTQIILTDLTPAFSDFGAPKALVETSRGGFNLINGIGIDTAGKNPCAVGCKWMANKTSYMNDVKFVGGHGLMPKDGSNPFTFVYNSRKTADGRADRDWDCQYASLWITENGGGVFKDIWSASPYAEAGIAITNTSTTGKMYCISLEHHVRHEIKMRNVEGWSFYALQTEEEGGEGPECLPIEMTNCSNLHFANLFLYRTLGVHRPFPYAILLWNCRNLHFSNIHNFTQMQYAFDDLMYDPAKKLTVRSWELASATVTGNERRAETAASSRFELLASGFSFAAGAALDSRGNLAFCDRIHKRIYRYLREEERLEPLCDIHFTPSCLFCDSEDNLVVAVDYMFPRDDSDNAAFRKIDYSSLHSYFSRSGKKDLKVYSICPEDPYNTMKELTTVPVSSAKPEVIYHPAHYWYPGKYLKHMEKPVTEYYMAPDGRTALYAVKDAVRSVQLAPAVPGSRFYSVDDSVNRVWAFTVTEDGSTTAPELFAKHGRYGAFHAADGSIWTVDDALYHHRPDGALIETFPLPDHSVCLTGNEDALYLVGRRSLYRMKL